MINNEVILSVIIPTYNHESYIAECIKGLLMQKINFQIEVIIGDDCSTDNNQNIIKDQISKNKDSLKTFHYIFHKENLSQPPNIPGKLNFLSCLEKAKGKYIHIYEGDDYWIDPYKLQKQVDFLEANPEYAVCFHDVNVFNQTKQVFEEDIITQKVPPTTTLIDLAKRNYIHTPSMIFRNYITPLPNWFVNTPVGDYPILCLAALTGKIYKLNEEMAVYRVHDAGAMSAIKKQNLSQKMVFNDGMYPFYSYMYKKSGIKTFQKKAISCINVNRNYALQEKQYALAKQYAKKALNHYFFQLTLPQLLGNILVLINPKLVKKIQ